MVTPTSRRLAAGAGVTVGATLAFGGAAQAATLTVGTISDTSTAASDCAVATNTDCRLRDAISAANAAPGSTITFASGLSGTIALSGSGLPQITQATTITGPGAGLLAVSGNHSFRPFDVSTSASQPVTISGLTITAGYFPGNGGGILNGGAGADLTLSGDVISDNHTDASGGDNGGGIELRRGTLTVTDSTITDNSSGNRGGGIDTASGTAGAATVRNSTISGNHSGTGGGTGGGGGIYFNYAAPATVENSTFYGNSTIAGGGGIYDYGPYLGGDGLTVTGSTFTHNSAARGGGIASYGRDISPAPIIQDTIVSGNTAATGSDLSASEPGAVSRDLCGCTMDTAFSLIGGVDPDTTINQTVPGSDIFGQDPQLGPLAGNGGPTQTQKPAEGSPVVDKGAAFGLTVDQRGRARPFDFPTTPNATAAGADGSDIGAFELQMADLPVPAPPPTTPATTPHRKKCKKKKKHRRSAESAKKKKCKKRKRA